MAERPLMPIERLRQLVSYCPETGLLFWKSREPNPSPSWNARFAGKEALGSKSKRGYKYGTIENQYYASHRVAWALHNSEWPVGEIDHINGDKSDNRIVNLRVVTLAQNLRNKSKYSNNKSGVAGIHLENGRWSARLSNRRVGMFATKEEAILARNAALSEHGYHVNHGRPK